MPDGIADFGPFTQFVSGVYTGLEDYNAQMQPGLKLSPNPASDRVQIKLPLGGSGNILLLNAMGQMVKSQYFSGGETELNLDQLPEGIYTVVFEGGTTVQNRKLVLCR
jgi:hypothetical protein